MNIVWLDDPRARQPELVGGKAAALGLLAPDYPVPLGFCVQVTGQRLRLEIEAQRGVAAAYTELAERLGIADAPVAVRSSAPQEDGHEASFAGQYLSLLNVRGADAVIEATEACLASAFSRRASAYRDRYGLEDAEGFTVLIQQLIPADASAVAFSIDPVAGNRDEVRVEATWGLGESLVSGRVTPDSFAMNKESGRVLRRQIATKERMTVCAAQGTEDVVVARARQRAPSLSDAHATEVAQLCRALETRFGFPVDIECAFHEGSLFLLQCRPVTAC